VEKLYCRCVSEPVLGSVLRLILLTRAPFLSVREPKSSLANERQPKLSGKRPLRHAACLLGAQIAAWQPMIKGKGTRRHRASARALATRVGSRWASGLPQRFVPHHIVQACSHSLRRVVAARRLLPVPLESVTRSRRPLPLVPSCRADYATHRSEWAWAGPSPASRQVKRGMPTHCAASQQLFGLGVTSRWSNPREDAASRSASASGWLVPRHPLPRTAL